MNKVTTASGQAIIHVNNFDLTKTLECGQCFRWSKNHDGSYTGVVQGKIVSARQKEDELLLYPASLDEVERVWIPYFDLKKDYGSMNQQILQQAPWMKKAADLGTGIRLLKQDPWETVMTFIFSANNNIPRITASVSCLAKTFGKYLGEGEDGPRHAFPSPDALQQLSLEDWQACGAGYRAACLMKTAAQWETHYQELIKVSAPIKELPLYHRQILEKLPGVGPKVSACISLYGLGHHNQFPVDVWIRRRVKALWPDAPETDRQIEEAAVLMFGDAAGYAQQLLFYEARHSKLVSLHK